MTDLTYIVRLHHKEKGLGFNARTALQNAQKQNHSVVKQAKFLGQPTGSKTEIEVIIDDSPMHKIIIDIIDASGQMTRKDGFYSIEDITLIIKEREDIKDLQQQYSSLEQQLSLAREENTSLHHEIDTNRMEVSTALKGLLAYFKTTSYTPETFLEDEVDLGFARIMFNSKTENKFVNYVNYMLNTNLSEGDIEGIFAYEIKSENEMDELRSKYETAKAELDFLDKLRSGEADIPGTLVQDYIKIIEEKEHNKNIQEHKTQIEEQEKMRSEQLQLTQLKGRYSLFSEKISLVINAGEEIPVIFNFKENSLELYFPFDAEGINGRFIGDLKKEIETYFENAIVEPLDNKFVAYEIYSEHGFRDSIEHITKDIPVILITSGFNKIVPYKLG